MRFSQVSWFMNTVVGPVKKKKGKTRKTPQTNMLFTRFSQVSWSINNAVGP